jgi:hypothetical protein
MKVLVKSFLTSLVSLSFLIMLLAATLEPATALADNDKVNDPPRVQTSTNGLVISLVKPELEGPIADQTAQIVVHVSDANGKALTGLHLTFLGVRDYSGQVDKEHNGPRDPNVGPYELKASTVPGEYTANGSFHNDGHWYFQVSGESLAGQTLTFNQRVQVNPADNGGIRIDWIVWPSVLVLVIIIVTVVGTRGEKIAVPAEDEGLKELNLAGKGGIK